MSAKKRLPFRAEHVGSLLRPAKLREAFRDHAAGKMTPDEFRAVQDESIRDVVRMQENVGLEAVTDGEFRRASYWSHFVEGIEGFGLEQARFDFHDEAGESVHFISPKVTGKLNRPGGLSGDELDFLRNETSKTPKITMPSPPTMHFWAKPDSVSVAGYADDAAFFADLAAVYHQELSDLASRGATYVQLDEVPLAMLCDETVRAKTKADGDDPDAVVGEYVDLINASVAGLPDTLTVAMHLCRGNFKGKWLTEGSYRYVADRLFNEINVDALFLEYDTPRAGDFAPLDSVPSNKSVVLGLVSSKVPELEAADALKRRIDEAGKHMSLDRLAISPQCGFASAVSGNPVTFEDEVAKLELVVKVARDVWG